MSVCVRLIEGPVGGDPCPCRRGVGGGPDASGHGACLRFDGVVRPLEDGRALAGLRYEAYEPMATNQLRLLAQQVLEEYGLLWICCVHSTGFVGVGECSLRVEIGSRHRAEGLRAMGAFIDRLKRDVPIWKSPVWAGPSSADG